MKTITCNKKMILSLLTYRNRRVNIAPELLKLIQDGVVFKENCILLRSFYIANRKHAIINQFEDLTAFETFINGFIINDFCNTDFFKNGCLFLDLVGNLVDSKCPNIPIEMILCKSNRNIHFTMHTIRTVEKSYLDNNIEEYVEPTMIVRHIPD